jgi:hypothetical protein
VTLVHFLSISASAIQIAMDGSLGGYDSDQCCRPTIDALTDFLFVRLRLDLVVKFVLSAAVTIVISEQFKKPWRLRRYENLGWKIKAAIDKAVRTVGAGGTMPATSAYKVLVDDLTRLLGPLAPLLAGHSAHHGWVGSLAAVLDPNAAKNKMDLQLIQVSHGSANKCQRLGAPFNHAITISATAADTAAHPITTVTPPTITPANPVPMVGGPVVNAAHNITSPGDRKFPIVIGNSHAFVEVKIKDVDGKARVICDCPSCTSMDDLITLTGAIPLPPGPPAPVGPVLSQPFNRMTGNWPGLKKRCPNAGELERFYAAAISDLNANWHIGSFVKVMVELHATMHSHR